MDTRQLAMSLIAAERCKVDDLVGMDMPVLLDAVMSNWQEYHQHHDVYKDGSKDAKAALRALREMLIALDALLAVAHRLQEAFALIEGTCSLHEEQESISKED